MNTELIESVIKSLDEINEKLDILNTRMTRIDKGKNEVTDDVRKLRQSMELIQRDIYSKIQG